MQRRTVIGTIGGIATGSVAVATLSTQPSRAQVTFGTLTVQDRGFEKTSEIQDVRINVNGNYQFDSEQVPQRWELKLLVGQNDEFAEIAEERMAPTTKADSGTQELSGSIFDVSHFAIENFRLNGQSEITKDIQVKLVFNVILNDETIASAEVQDTTTLTITPGNVEATAKVKGTGEISISR